VENQASRTGPNRIGSTKPRCLRAQVHHSALGWRDRNRPDWIRDGKPALPEATSSAGRRGVAGVVSIRPNFRDLVALND